MSESTARPEFVAGEHLEFLDDLRTSGVTNMWGGSIYLESEFSLSDGKARKVLAYWMETFSDRGRPRGIGNYRFGKPTISLNIHIRRRKKSRLFEKG